MSSPVSSPKSLIEIAIKKQDAEQQIVFGEVFAPNVTDAQGDRMSTAEIAKAAYLFMAKGRLAKIDTNHDLQPNGSYIVESFVAREGDPTFIPGAWVIGVKVPDPALWAAIKKGELNGFSLDGAGFREETTVEVEIPEELSGLTDRIGVEGGGHAHQFTVRFDPDGTFLGGETDVVQGHRHTITQGTLTDESAGHSHRFSYVEGLLHEL